MDCLRPAATSTPASPALGHRTLALPPVTSLALSPETLAVVRQFTQAAAPRPVPIGEKLWLDLDEAAAYSGLAKSDQRGVCRNGTLTARKSGGWKIRRHSLEEFGG